MLLSASSRRFPLTAELANIAECTPQTLQYRQDEMVRLIADHWNIRYDADDTDLSTLNEETLNVKATASSPTSKRVSIAQVLEAGLLIAGETLVWERPRKGERWVATVTSEGKLRMDDGREYATPTAAARAVGGSSAGLTVWKRTSNGQKLSDVAQALRTPNDQMDSLNQPDSINRIQPVNARPAIRRRVWCDWRCWFWQVCR